MTQSEATPPSWRTGAAAAGWLTIVVAVVELCGRELARQSLLRRIAGLSIDVWPLVGLAAAGAVLAALARRRSPRLGRAPLLFAVLFAAGVALQLNLGARLQSDGFYYYAYLRSLAFDGDVNFMNDYRLLGLGDKPHLFVPTATGHAHSAWTIGPAIVWSPFFAVGHAIASRLGATNPNVSADGISFPYRQAVCLAGLLYGLLGSWFCFRIAARFHARRVAALATVAVMGGSFMLWYVVKEPSMTHAPSMAGVAGFTWAWLATRERRRAWQWALLGGLAGFIGLIRWQNVLFALLPATDSALALTRAWRRSDRPAVAAALRDGVLFMLCATIAFLPQMLAWRAIYGSWLAVSPVGPQIRWTDPHIVDILWSSRNGLLSWSPVLYAGAIGLLLFAWRNRSAGIPMLAAVAVMTYFNSAIQDWWGSDGFGGRRFDGTIPFFCVGAAAFTAAAVRAVERHPLRVLASAGAALVLWNLTLMSAAHKGVYRIGDILSFGDVMPAQAREFHAWFGNPFTYPPGLLFSLRNGVSPGRYDLLSANRFLSDPTRQYGIIDAGGADAWAIEDGWHAPERDGAVTFRWTEQVARMLVPLDKAATLRVQVRCRALSFAGSPAQTLTLAVNSRPQPRVPVKPGWETVDIRVDESHWRSGVNRVELRFAWAARPADVGLGGDGRSLAAQVDYVRVQAETGAANR